MISLDDASRIICYFDYEMLSLLRLAAEFDFLLE